MARRFRGLLWVLVVLALGGCVSSPRTQTIIQPAAVEPRPGPAPVVITGRASWYGEPHHGRLTASGEAFNMNAMTAAHPTLPFGTRLRVVNLDNDREVEVRINDRGPSTPGRMLDLSYAAARALGAVGTGVIPVRATVLSSN